MTVITETLARRAERALGQGRYEEALALLRERLATEGASSQLLSDAGFAAWHAGNIDEARRHLHRALELDARHFDALINLLELYLQAGLVQEAATYLDRLRTLYGDEPAALLVIARNHFTQRELTEALRCVGRATTKASGQKGIQISAVRLLLEQGCPDAAINLAKSNIDAGIEHADFYDFWAKALIVQNKLHEAEAVYNQMRVHYPDRIAPLCGLATIKLLVGLVREAEEIVDLVRAKHPDDAEALRLCLAILARLKDWDRMARVTAPYLGEPIPLLLPLVFHLYALERLGRTQEAGVILGREAERFRELTPERIEAIVKQMSESSTLN